VLLVVVTGVRACGFVAIALQLTQAGTRHGTRYVRPPSEQSYNVHVSSVASSPTCRAVPATLQGEKGAILTLCTRLSVLARCASQRWQLALFDRNQLFRGTARAFVLCIACWSDRQVGAHRLQHRNQLAVPPHDAHRSEPTCLDYIERKQCM
jgi:hypothetical protein